jgi:hypothetical protein
MPCGGIYPIAGSALEKFTNDKQPCWMCDKGSCDCFCDEWDTMIHSACVPAFLETDEGKIVLAHRHEVIVMRDGARVVLFGEEYEHPPEPR